MSWCGLVSLDLWMVDRDTSKGAWNKVWEALLLGVQSTSQVCVGGHGN